MASRSTRTVPALIYGTAWKKEATTDLVHQAILAGFRGIDTAAQPKHYREDLVGAGIRSAIKAGQIERKDLYIQTKYTSVHGQDVTQMPYEELSSITEQVLASARFSLKNLRMSDEGDGAGDFIDCLVMHSPLPSTEETLEAWTAMESLVPDVARTLGVSNVYQLPVLQHLYDSATVKPSVVQNRFFAGTRYDAGIRAYCREKGIVYQSFWTLTANPHLLKSEPVRSLASATGSSREVALYALVLGLGNGTSMLNGTKNSDRMKADLEGLDKINDWSQGHMEQWEELKTAFEALLL